MTRKQSILPDTYVPRRHTTMFSYHTYPNVPYRVFDYTTDEQRFRVVPLLQLLSKFDFNTERRRSRRGRRLLYYIRIKISAHVFFSSFLLLSFFFLLLLFYATFSHANDACLQGWAKGCVENISRPLVYCKTATKDAFSFIVRCFSQKSLLFTYAHFFL